MKYISIIICLLFIKLISFSQSTFDQSINEVSTDMADKLTQKVKKKIVVLYVTDFNKSQTVVGKYIADVISVNIVNNIGNFEVFDRENLSGITEAKKLMAEGYIDANKAKELGRILAVEAIIIGNYTVLSSTLKLTLKALDVNNGFVIAASIKDLPINADAEALLGIKGSSAENNSNRGFNNRPLNSNEQYNNSETVSKGCEAKNTGDYCFENRSDKVGHVRLDGTSVPNITLDPGQTQCFYNLIAVNYSYKYWLKDKEDHYVKEAYGQILVEKCKSKTFIMNEK